MVLGGPGAALGRMARGRRGGAAARVSARAERDVGEGYAGTGLAGCGTRSREGGRGPGRSELGKMNSG